MASFSTSPSRAIHCLSQNNTAHRFKRCSVALIVGSLEGINLGSNAGVWLFNCAPQLICLFHCTLHFFILLVPHTNRLNYELASQRVVTEDCTSNAESTINSLYTIQGCSFSHTCPKERLQPRRYCVGNRIAPRPLVVLQ